MTEFFDVVDDDDRVVGRASRKECHEKGLLHRSVMFFIFDKKWRVLVNKRSDGKEFFKGMWSIVLGGHVASGDSYDDTAVREAKEEAGLDSPPFRIGYFKKRLPEEKENVMVYGFKADGMPALLKDEIEFGQFMAVAEAEKKMGEEPFIPETRQLLALLKWHLISQGPLS